MRVSKTLIGLSVLIVILASVAAGSGFFWQDDGSSYTVTTLRGEQAEIFGQGLYRYDSLFTGAANRGTDLVTLGLGIPLLLFSGLFYWRRNLRLSLLLPGTLIYFLYIYASYSLGTAYNPLFLIYIMLFAASLWAFSLAFRSIDQQIFSVKVSPNLPRRGPAIFMISSGLVTLIVWLVPLLDALIQNTSPPLLGAYTTKITDVLDLGIITPAAFIAGILILYRNRLGYVIALSMLVLEIILAPMIVAQTVSQLMAGISFSTGEIVGPMSGFILLALVASWMLVDLLRHIADDVPDDRDGIEQAKPNNTRILKSYQAHLVD